jgi:hypothetical protein
MASFFNPPKSFTVVVSSDDGKWWAATEEQEEAYRLWNEMQRELRTVWVKERRYNLKEVQEGLGGWNEIQSTKDGKWRKIQTV